LLKVDVSVVGNPLAPQICSFVSYLS
jgi:hypothetical protein